MDQEFRDSMRRLAAGIRQMRLSWAQPYLAQKSTYPPGTAFTVEKYGREFELERVHKPHYWPHVKPFVPRDVGVDTWPFTKQPWGRRDARA